MAIKKDNLTVYKSVLFTDPEKVPYRDRIDLEFEITEWCIKQFNGRWRGSWKSNRPHYRCYYFDNPKDKLLFDITWM